MNQSKENQKGMHSVPGGKGFGGVTLSGEILAREKRRIRHCRMLFLGFFAMAALLILAI